MFYEGRDTGCVAMATGTSAGLWDILNCEETNTFLCKQLVEGVTPPPPPPTTSPPLFCPEGWQSVSQSSFCFKVGVSFLNANVCHLNKNIFCSCMEGGFYPAYLIDSLQYGWEMLGKAVCVWSWSLEPQELWDDRKSKVSIIKFDRLPEVEWTPRTMKKSVIERDQKTRIKIEAHICVSK